eukprot:COSAG04_NODE_954_length_9193_cov_9.021113_8_plen_344_part_00
MPRGATSLVCERAERVRTEFCDPPSKNFEAPSDRPVSAAAPTSSIAASNSGRSAPLNPSRKISRTSPASAPSGPISTWPSGSSELRAACCGISSSRSRYTLSMRSACPVSPSRGVTSARGRAPPFRAPAGEDAGEGAGEDEDGFRENGFSAGFEGAPAGEISGSSPPTGGAPVGMRSPSPPRSALSSTGPPGAPQRPGEEGSGAPSCGLRSVLPFTRPFTIFIAAMNCWRDSSRSHSRCASAPSSAGRCAPFPMPAPSKSAGKPSSRQRSSDIVSCRTAVQGDSGRVPFTWPSTCGCYICTRRVCGDKRVPATSCKGAVLCGEDEQNSELRFSSARIDAKQFD